MKRIVVAAVCAVIMGVGGRYSAQIPPGQAKFRRQVGEWLPNQYIVVLRDTSASSGAIADLSDELSRGHGGARFHTYTHVLQGFAVRLTEPSARQLSEDPRVAYVEEDGIVRGNTAQLNPPSFGLDRIDQRTLPLNDSYWYFADGTGVNAYVVDTGIRVTHSAFQGRAHGAFSAVDDGIPPDQDCHGHGTHVAGILGSSLWGVAKKVNLFSVKALGCDATGSWSGYIAALDWIAANGVRPAVVNASIGGGLDTAATESIERLVAAGFTFVGAAGNNTDNACGYVPGAAAAAIVVGSVDAFDVRAVDSNWGSCLDLFAPGYGIVSASNVSDTAFATMYGTSMAAPHVAGAAALYLQRFPAAAPAAVSAEILRGATRGVLGDILPGSPNLLLFSPYLGDTVLPTATLTAPANGATVSATVTLTATSSDNVELQGVRFFVGSTQIANDTAAPYTFAWDSTSVADGTYSLRARAVDLAGNARDSTASVSVRNAIDTTPPAVLITSPVSGATVAGVVSIQVEAVDNVAVARVEFISDGVTIGSDSSAPYTTSWNTRSVPNGNHTLVARAFDSSANTKLSTSVVVQVDNVASSALPIGWANADVGAVGQPGSAGDEGGTFVLQAGGTDIWSTADAFHFAYRTWTGDGEIVARVASVPLPQSASFALAGVMFRESLAANARHMTVLIGSNGKLKFRRRMTVGGTTLSDGPSEGSVSVPHWLKVTRRGNVFTAYRSTDGGTWTRVGPVTTLALPTTLRVGVWALRNGGTALAQATLTNVKVSTVTGPLPSGWTSADVGAVGQAGNAGHESGTFALQAGGTDIWSTADAFHYVYRAWTGDGEIVARVASLRLPGGASYAMAGVMFRESLAASARHATVLIGTNGKLKFRRRTTVSGQTLSDGPPEGSLNAPYWLKISRRGNVFTAYRSEDGATWTQVGPAATLTLPTTLHAGVWALRNGGTALADAALTNVKVNTVAAVMTTESPFSP